MKKTIGFTVVTIFLVLVTALSVAGVAKCQSSEDMKINESYYQELEQEYVKTMREYLDEAGFLNSGVMLTRTVCEDGSRECHISIHNGRFDSLTEEEKEALIRALSEKAFEEEHCSFVYSLTGNA